MTKEMNCCTRKPETAQSDSVATTVQRIHSWALSPQGLTIAGIAAAVVGLTLGWSWVVALGVAPLILTLGPCLVMCALGLCMNRMAGRSRSTETTLQNPADPGADRAAPRVSQAIAATAPDAKSPMQETRTGPHV